MIGLALPNLFIFSEFSGAPAMKLQLALDTVDIGTALSIIEGTIDFIDIVEIGTPMIIEYGMESVRAVKARFPRLRLLADTKIMDAGAYEAKMAFDAGADIVTVMGLTHDETVSGAVESAKRARGEILVDMMCVKEMEARALELIGLGARYVCVHTAVDVQSRSDPYQDLLLVQRAVGSSNTAIAGGINIETIHRLLSYQPAIVIVGNGITGQADMSMAAAAIRKALS
jgi:3-hexulose-6-phosphate synthase